MENNKITIRARCKICGHAATNFLPWPVTDNLVTCPVCGKHFDADAKALEKIYSIHKPVE